MATTFDLVAFLRREAVLELVSGTEDMGVLPEPPVVTQAEYLLKE